MPTTGGTCSDKNLNHEKVTLDFSAMRQRLTGLYPAGVPKSLNTIVITRVPG